MVAVPLLFRDLSADLLQGQISTQVLSVSALFTLLLRNLSADLIQAQISTQVAKEQCQPEC